MQRDLAVYAWDTVSSVDDIFGFVEGLDLQDYLQSKLVQAAVERKLEIIGEAANQAEKLFPGRLTAVENLPGLIGFRNRLRMAISR